LAVKNKEKVATKILVGGVSPNEKKTRRQKNYGAHISSSFFWGAKRLLFHCGSVFECVRMRESGRVRKREREKKRERERGKRTFDPTWTC